MKGLRRLTKKSMGLLLSVIIAASMMPVSAFAVELEGPIIITPDNQAQEGVIEGNVNGTVAVTTDPEAFEVPEGQEGSEDQQIGGNVSATVNGSIASQDDYYGCGLDVFASNGNTATVTTKDITYSGEEGGGIIAFNNSGTAKVTVDGNVRGTEGGIGVNTQAGKTEIAITGNISGGEDGITTNTYKGGQADLTVTGNVSGGEHGINAETFDGGRASYVINGNVSSETRGIYANTYGCGEASITVTGDVEGKDRCVIIRASDPTGESSDEGTTTVTVDGNVKGHRDGVYAFAMTGASAKINVTGDLISDKYGLNAVTWGKNGNIGKVDVLVEGTIDGGEVGIALQEKYKTNITVTAWKITPNKDGWVAGDYESTDNDRVLTGEDVEFEKTINYIIKVEQPAEGATLSASQGTAHEGENVALRIDLQDGYTVTGAFGDEGKSLPLLKDASGNYYVVVPKGGGVYLSVTLDKLVASSAEPYIPVKASDASSSESHSNQDQPSTADTTTAVTAADISAQIANALAIDPSATSVSLDLGVSPSIGAEVLNALCEKSTVAKSCGFTVDGKKYTLIIPAFDADSELYKQCLALLAFEPGGTAGPLRLAQIFAALGFRIVEG